LPLIRQMNLQISRLLRLLPATLLLVIIPNTVCSAELVLDDAALHRYAMYLYRNGEYYRAVTEFKRLIYYFPDCSLAMEADLQIGRSFMASGRLDEAAEYWKVRIDSGDAGGAVLNRMKILYGISLLDLNATDPYPLRRGNIETALSVLQEVAAVDDEGRWVRRFVDDWKALPALETKSPQLAGAMSAVVPGSGSFYVGRRREGLYAFFLTVLFGLATADAAHAGDNALANLFGFFTLAFYGGNIYTAVNSTHKYNDNLYSEALNSLRRQNGIWFIPETPTRSGRF